MPLQIYDTLAREKRAFIPADPARVTLYVCGPTVYSYAHIGNARSAVAFDLLFRLLRATYGDGAVIYARNVTDVDDKIIAAHRESGEPIEAITAKFERIYAQDMAGLGCLAPTLTPHATHHVPEMLSQIERLVENGNGYAAEGHVLFDVESFADYGRLSGRSLDDMIAGARVEVAPYKKNPQDFVLWKPSKSDDEPAWDSPWGRGRPGWHLECSAMIEAVLGLPVDIHGGGHDLIFPHHENEIAQGRCATGGDVYARYWMHNGFLSMDAEKMSKSLGNVVLAHDLLKQAPGEVLRWALLSAHYRAPLDWTSDLIAQSRKSLDRLYGVLQRAADLSLVEEAAPAGPVLDALEDDLNTPRAYAELFALAKALEAADDDHVRAKLKGDLLASARLLGFLQQDPEAWFSGGADEALREKVETLISQRVEARRAKNWAEADRIRAALDDMGVVVMDNPEGATWRMRDPA